MVVRAQARPLVGRQRERAVLERLLDTARDGHGAVLVVHGDPGVGKTALLEYLVEVGEDFRVVRAAGVEGEMELDYAALQQLCSPVLEFAERLPDPQRDALGVAFGLSAGRAPSTVSSSGLPFLASFRKLPSSGRCCASSTTRSGSTAHRRERSRSWRTACWRRGSRSPSRRVSSAVDRPASRSSTWSRWAAGMPGRCWSPSSRRGSTRPCSSGSSPRQVGIRSRSSSFRAGCTPAQLAGGFGLPAALPLSTGIEQSFTRRLVRLPRDARRLLLLAAAEPVGEPCASVACRAAAWDSGDGCARSGVGRLADAGRCSGVPSSARALGGVRGGRAEGPARGAPRAGGRNRS